MYPGDLVWVKSLEKYATITDVHQPTVRYPAMIVDVIFFDGAEASTFYATSLKLIAPGDRKEPNREFINFLTN